MALTGAERMARLRERQLAGERRCATGVRKIAAAGTSNGRRRWAHWLAAWMLIRFGETTCTPVSRTAPLPNGSTRCLNCAIWLNSWKRPNFLGGLDEIKQEKELTDTRN
jgi:hypothetical protein